MTNLLHKPITDGILKVNLSTYLSQKLGLDYAYLSTIFSEIENNTIDPNSENFATFTNIIDNFAIHLQWVAQLLP